MCVHAHHAVGRPSLAWPPPWGSTQLWYHHYRNRQSSYHCPASSQRLGSEGVCVWVGGSVGVGVWERTYMITARVIVEALVVGVLVM